MTDKLLPYDSAEHFRTPEDQSALLEDAFASNDPAYLAHAIGIVARAHGMTDLERKTGVKRQHLYSAFSQTGNPTLATVTKVLSELGFRL